MPQPYDASTKYLVDVRLPDWLPLSGRPTTAAMEVIDADLSTVTAAADRVLRVQDTPPWLMHLELQSSRDPAVPVNLHVYNALLERRHGLPVQTVLVLLRQKADAPELTGELQRSFPGEPPYLVFRYRVVRVWKLPPATLLQYGGLVPLAPLGAVTEPELPALIQQMDQRIRQEARTLEEVGTLWTAADVLMGLRWPRELVERLLQGVQTMEESVTYQAIVEKGAVKALHRLLLEQGRSKFGPAPEAIEQALRNITDVERLDRLGVQLLRVSSWQELLAVS